MTTTNQPIITVKFMPWASWDTTVVDRLVHICPLCEERINEPHKKGKNIERHYKVAHNL